MPDYEVLTLVSCGDSFQPGDTIPDGILLETDAKALLELGCIKLAAKEVKASLAAKKTQSKKTSKVASEEKLSNSGSADDPKNILDYVNHADQEGLEAIKGIGTATAKAMLNHGEFRTMEELAKLVPNVNWQSVEVS